MLAAGEEAAAIQRLVEAARNEIARGQANSGSKLADMSVALLQRNKQWTAAYEIAKEASLEFRGNEPAAALHLKGIAGLAQALRADPSQEAREEYEQALRLQLTTWPVSTATDTAQGWLRSWLVGQDRQTEFLSQLLQRAQQCPESPTQNQVFTSWLGDMLRASESARQASMEELVDAIQTNKLSGSLPTSIAIASKGFMAWPDAKTSREIDNYLRDWQQKKGWSDEFESHLLQSLLMLRHIQLNKVQQANTLSEEWNFDSLPSPVQLGVVPRFVEGITESQQSHELWVKVLQWDKNLAEQLLQEKAAVQRSYGLRIQHWLGDSSAVTRLRELASTQPRDGWLQLQLCQLLAETDSNLSQAASIAKRLAANSKPGSPLNFAARWQLMKIQVQAGQAAKAKQAAQLFLASQPLEEGVWKERFESLAGP